MEQSYAETELINFECNVTNSDGIGYQRYLAIDLLLKATQENRPFKLAFEMKSSKCFDDVVFYLGDRNEWWFIQTKHSKNPGKLTYDKLYKTENSNYFLSSYLKSFYNIRYNELKGQKKVHYFHYFRDVSIVLENLL